MNLKSSLAKSLCIAAMTFSMATTANAAALRTFVSGFGSDGNTATNCSHAQPCRTFAVAVTVTAPGGEIEALDPAGYGPITISGPLTLVGLPGAAINAPSGGAGITINAGPNDAVHVQGLLIDGGGVGNEGIRFLSGKSLVIDNCVVRNLQGSGIGLAPTTSATIAVSKTLVSDNGMHGIYLQPSGIVVVSALFNQVEAYHSGQQGIGIFVNFMTSGSVMNAMIVDSVAGFNGNAGFYALRGLSIVNGNINVSRSTTLANGSDGVMADGGISLVVSQSNLQDVWAQSSNSCVYSYGDNYTNSVSPPQPNGCGSVFATK